MNKQHLYGLINPFERIAGWEALLWGLGRNGGIDNPFLLFRLALSRVATFWSGSESGLVVLCSGTLCRLDDSGCYVLFGRIAAFPFPHTDGRRVGYGRFRTITVDRHEPLQFLATYAEACTDRCEYVPDRDHATARIPCRDMAVACLFCLFDLGTGLDVPGIESVL